MPLGKVRLRLEQRKEGEVTLRRGGLGQPLSNQLRSGRQLIHPVLCREEAVAARSDGSEPQANGTLVARSPVA